MSVAKPTIHDSGTKILSKFISAKFLQISQTTKVLKKVDRTNY